MLRITVIVHTSKIGLQVRLKQTLDCRLPRVLGSFWGLFQRPASYDMPAPSVLTHLAPPMVQFS